MKTIFKKTIIVLAAMMATTGAWADNGDVLISEDFEDYTTGYKIAAQASEAGKTWWTTWSNNSSDEDGLVASGSNNKYGHLTYGNDQVLLFGDITSGQYELSFDIYLPEGKNGYFNILHSFGFYNEHAMQCYLNATHDGQYTTPSAGNGTVHAGSCSTANITCVSNAWMHFRIVIDIDADKAELYVKRPGEAEDFRCDWQWSLDSYGGNVVGPNLVGMDFYPPKDASTSEFYVDNIVLKDVIVDDGSYALSVGSSEHGTITFTNAEGDTITSAKPNEVVTVTVAPDKGYVVDSISGECSTTWETAAARRAAPGLLQSYELIPVEGVENQWTFTMKATQAQVSAYYKKLLSSPDITISGISSELTYDGNEKKPTFTVKDGDNELTENTDYTVTYSNNVNAGLSTDENAPSITISALATSDVYVGDTTITFTINKAAGSISYEVTSLDKSKGDTFINELKVEGDGTVTYSLTGSKIATVDEKTGSVTITDAPGAFAIVATVEDGTNYTYETATASYVVTVSMSLGAPFINDGDDPTIVAHKLALATVLKKAKEIDTTDMTTASATTLEDAIDNAKETLDKKDVTVDELDAARIALLKAIDEVEKMETTGISGKSGMSMVNGQWSTVNGYYDLQGRKMKSLKKGIYIYKGKKVKR